MNFVPEYAGRMQYPAYLGYHEYSDTDAIYWAAESPGSEMKH